MQPPAVSYRGWKHFATLFVNIRETVFDEAEWGARLRTKAGCNGSLRRVLEQFGAAAREAYKRRGWVSLRQASIATGIDHTTIARMMKGTTPGASTIHKWATALREPPAKWLALAQGLTWDGPDVEEPPHGVTLEIAQPPIPAAIRAAIDASESREDKIGVAFAYLRSLPGIRLGADAALSVEARLSVVRMYEKMSGLEVLPLEVI